MRISEVAEKVGVPVSTVRYYERIGLLAEPARTSSGYRAYDDRSATRLLFLTRARRLGLTCDQILELLPVWDGTHCSTTHEEVARLIDGKLAEIAARIEELSTFAAQLESVRQDLAAAPPPQACRDDLSCCVPSAPGCFVPLTALTTLTTLTARVS